MATILIEGTTAEFPAATAAGDDLWLPAGELGRQTGWALKPEGLCREDFCVPVPSTGEDGFVRDGSVNLPAFWRLLERPVLHDEAGESWAFGADAGERARRLLALEAPDFALPDLEGRTHALSHYRGKRVLLATWASW